MNDLQTIDKGELLNRKITKTIQSVPFEINNDEDYGLADQWNADTQNLLKHVKDWWAPLKNIAYKSWQMNCEKEKSMLAPIVKQKKKLEALMLGYVTKRNALEWERQKAEAKKQRQDLCLDTMEMAESGTPQRVIDEIHEDHLTLESKEPQELRGKTKFKDDYIVTIQTIEDEEGNEIEQWDQVDKELLLPKTKAHKEAILNNAREMARRTYGKKITGFNIKMKQKARVIGSK